MISFMNSNRVGKMYLNTSFIVPFVFSLFCVFYIAGCENGTNVSEHRVGGKCTDPHCFLYGAELLIGLNQSADPCDDFYEYVCGKWIEYYKPDSKSYMDEQTLEINRKIRVILEGPIDEKEEALKKAQEFYQHCIELNSTEAYSTVLKVVDEFGGWPILQGATWDDTHRFEWFDDLFPLLAKLRRVNYNGGLFDVYVDRKESNNSLYAITLYQPTDWKTYAQQPEGVADEEYLLELFKQINPNLNEENAKKEIQEIIELYTAIDDNLEEIDMDDIASEILSISVEKLTDATKVDWLKFLNIMFEGIKVIKPEDEIELGAINYFEKLKWIVYKNEHSARTIMNYELLYFFGSFLSDVIATDNSPILCANLVEKYYSYVLSVKFEEVYMNSKKMVEKGREMTVNIFNAYDERMNDIEWFDSLTRSKAKEKLKAMKDYFLYPAWAANTSLVNEYYAPAKTMGNLIEDVVAYSRSMNWQEFQALVTKPKLEGWIQSPTETNAFNNLFMNSIYFLTGMMEYPTFHEGLLNVMNYGSFGLIIAHEITHGFDRDGIQFDQNGNLKHWMTNSVEKVFLEKTQCLIDQYFEYSLTPEDLPGTDGYRVNGSSTVNENIADNGGIRQAYRAYKKWVSEYGEEALPEPLQDFTNDQIFFMSFAKDWCIYYGKTTNWTDIFINDPHSPNKLRVIGSLSNLKEFSETFHCPKDSKMNRGDKACVIW